MRADTSNGKAESPARARLALAHPSLRQHRPRMGGAIDRIQALGVDVGIALRRRQAGMPQQLLDGPQIAAGAQQMGGEGVAKRVRRHALGQAESAAQVAHHQSPADFARQVADDRIFFAQLMKDLDIKLE